jgi:phosphoglycolate phosphatase
MATPVILFDLDGTLVDTAPDLVATLNLIFAREGLPAVVYNDARNMVGGGARLMIERGLAANGRAVGEVEIDRMVRDYIDHYAAHIADRSRPFPGVEAALDQLAGRGCRFAVCTNKLEWLSVRLLDALGLSRRFAAICGADTFGLQKPNPDFLRRTIERVKGEVTSAVMVGDSLNDISPALAAGIPVIAVDFGYSETPVRDLSPNRVISAFAELPGAIFGILDGTGRAPG